MAQATPSRSAGDRPDDGRSPRYVLATAAYNEARRIEATLRSVASQSRLPAAWVIVSDGSTDGTDDIVRKWAGKHPFISLLRVEKSEQHDFGAKVRALRRAFDRLSHVTYDYVGILDADVWFESDYFERLLSRFEEHPRLGVAGGNIVQRVAGRDVPRIKDLGTVAGAVQMLRRECFEQTGGLRPLRHGGEDAAMEIAARMHGWQTRTFPELPVMHDGLVGGGAGGPTRARFKWGRANFALGYHPLYQVARAANRARERPYLVGSVAELVGYAVGKLRDGRPSVEAELVRYLRREQLEKLRTLVRR